MNSQKLYSVWERFLPGSLLDIGSLTCHRFGQVLRLWESLNYNVLINLQVILVLCLCMVGTLSSKGQTQLISQEVNSSEMPHNLPIFLILLSGKPGSIMHHTQSCCVSRFRSSKCWPGPLLLLHLPNSVPSPVSSFQTWSVADHTYC